VAQVKMAERFMKKNPDIVVKVIPVQESELPKKIVAAVAADTLPDVMRLGLEFVFGYSKAGIIDAASATELISEIGDENFFSGALDLLRDENGNVIAVPVDGWVQGIYYRKDWFEKEALAPPDSWERMLIAARKLSQPSLGVYGIVAGTDPSQVYTQQMFEHIALSDGVRLFDRDGKFKIVNDDAEKQEMLSVLQFYKQLIKYSPPGNNYWREAQRYYLTGRAAMIFYSNYIADDIAGLAEQHSPVVENLARNTGFVPILRQDPNDTGASYGQIVTLALSRTADVEASKRWIMYLMHQEYLRLINMAPGGKIPMLKSAVDKWANGKVFKDYDNDFAATLVESLAGIKRWGFVEGKYYSTISDITGRKIFPKIISQMARNRLTPFDALEELSQRLEQYNE